MSKHYLSEDGQSGYFSDDEERLLCRWNWDAESKVLSVRCGPHERPVDLSSFGLERLGDEELTARLIDLAKSTGEGLRGTPFDAYLK